MHAPDGQRPARQIFPQNQNQHPNGSGSQVDPHRGDSLSHHSSNHSSAQSLQHSTAQSIRHEYPAALRQQREVSDLHTNLSNLSTTVQALQRNLDTMNTANQNHLSRIDETNTTIAASLLKNSEDLRRFTREDIGPIIAANITNAMKQDKRKRRKKRRKKRRRNKGNGGSDSSSSDSSSDDSTSSDDDSHRSSKKNDGKDSTPSSVFMPPPTATTERPSGATDGNSLATSTDFADMLKGVIQAVQKRGNFSSQGFKNLQRLNMRAGKRKR